MEFELEEVKGHYRQVIMDGMHPRLGPFAIHAEQSASVNRYSQAKCSLCVFAIIMSLAGQGPALYILVHIVRSMFVCAHRRQAMMLRKSPVKELPSAVLA